MTIGKVYKITSKHNPNISYIGSTIQPLNVRLSKHKHDYKRYSKGKHNYVTSYEVIKLGDCKIDLIKEVTFDKRSELRKIEAGYVKTDQTCVNKIYS